MKLWEGDQVSDDYDVSGTRRSLNYFLDRESRSQLPLIYHRSDYRTSEGIIYLYIELELRRASHDELVVAVAARVREADIADELVRELEGALRRERTDATEELSNARCC